MSKQNNNPLNLAATVIRQEIMKNHFVSYDKVEFDGDNNQNIIFEMMALCISDGTRIIIEQNKKRGERYLMVDFQPTDGSNTEAPMDGVNVGFISSVDGEDEGAFFEDFRNYMDVCLWICNFIKNGDFTQIYIETY